MQQLGQHAFHATLRAVQGPALVVFTSEGCSVCARLKAVLRESPPPGVTLFEVDAHHSSAIASEHEVFHLPAMFLYVDGHYHAPIHSELNAASLHRAIAQAAHEPAQEPP